MFGSGVFKQKYHGKIISPSFQNKSEVLLLYGRNSYQETQFNFSKMSANSMDREMSKLQQDAPVAILPELPNTNEMIAELEKPSKSLKEVNKPFFLSPPDGLYGLL